MCYPGEVGFSFGVSARYVIVNESSQSFLGRKSKLCLYPVNWGLCRNTHSLICLCRL